MADEAPQPGMRPGVDYSLLNRNWLRTELNHLQWNENHRAGDTRPRAPSRTFVH